MVRFRQVALEVVANTQLSVGKVAIEHVHAVSPYAPIVNRVLSTSALSYTQTYLKIFASVRDSIR